MKLISEELAASGFEVVSEGKRASWEPDEAMLEDYKAYGRELAEKFR